MTLQRRKDEAAELRNESERRLLEIAERREALSRRLHQLYLRRDRQGADTPPEVVTEIEDSERRIADLDIQAELAERKLGQVEVAEKVINGGAVSNEVLNILRQLAPNEVVIKTQFVQQQELRDIRRELREGLDQRREETTKAIDEVKDDVGQVRDAVTALVGPMASMRTLVLGLLLVMVLGGCATWWVLIYVLQRGG